MGQILGAGRQGSCRDHPGGGADGLSTGHGGRSLASLPIWALFSTNKMVLQILAFSSSLIGTATERWGVYSPGNGCSFPGLTVWGLLSLSDVVNKEAQGCPKYGLEKRKIKGMKI